MIQFNDIHPCADNHGSFQCEGCIDGSISNPTIESILVRLDFKLISVGSPPVLICKRSDCLLLIYSDLRFTLSEAASKEKMLEVLKEFEAHLMAI